MPHYSENRCTVCGAITSPELLTVIRVQFASRTSPSKLIKSRTIAWACEHCLSQNEFWHLPAYKGAPGMTSAALERVRKDEVT